MFLTSRRICVAVAALGLVVGGSGVALAQGGSHRSHDGHGHHGRYDSRPSADVPHAIPNLGKVKNQIEAYYGDTGDHVASKYSTYAHDVAHVRKRARRMLPRLIRRVGDTPVVLVDVDDTTLLTYNYEATNDFGYDPEENADYIHNHGMRAVFGMPKLLNRASRMGAEVYYLTGRPESQKADTMRGLENAGYPDVTDKRVYLHNEENPPSYLTCAPDCSTVQYKSLTRKHIDSLGNQIVLNMGDQHSDLKGGFSDRTLKLPNPMYFLP